MENIIVLYLFFFFSFRVEWTLNEISLSISVCPFACLYSLNWGRSHFLTISFKTWFIATAKSNVYKALMNLSPPVRRHTQVRHVGKSPSLSLSDVAITFFQILTTKTRPKTLRHFLHIIVTWRAAWRIRGDQNGALPSWILLVSQPRWRHFSGCAFIYK